MPVTKLFQSPVFTCNIQTLGKIYNTELESLEDYEKHVFGFLHGRTVRNQYTSIIKRIWSDEELHSYLIYIFIIADLQYNKKIKGYNAKLASKQTLRHRRGMWFLSRYSKSFTLSKRLIIKSLNYKIPINNHQEYHSPSIELSELIPNNISTPQTQILDQEYKDKTHELLSLDKLTSREKIILHQFYYDGMTKAAIARHHNLSNERICQLIKIAIKKIKCDIRRHPDKYSYWLCD